MYSAERSILGTALVQSDTRTITNCIVLTILQMAAGKHMPPLQNYIFFMLIYHKVITSHHIHIHATPSINVLCT